jgi:response regulator NasT
MVVLASSQRDRLPKVLVIDESRPRAAILEAGLRSAGLSDVHVIDDYHRLIERIYDLDPDVILIDLQNPSRDILEQMFQVSMAVRRPVAMFVDESDQAMIGAAVDAGVGAYVVGGLREDRVKNIMDLAISRFNAYDRLRRELDETRSKLEERKLIERAKGIIMAQQGIEEDAAYALLRKTAMNQKRRIYEVAASVVSAADLLRRD